MENDGTIVGLASTAKKWNDEVEYYNWNIVVLAAETEEEEEEEISNYQIIADWEDMNDENEWFPSPKQYGLTIFEGTWQECRDELDRLRNDYYSHGYSMMEIVGGEGE